MSGLEIVSADISVVGIILAQGRRILVLPRGTIDDKTVADANLLLSITESG